MDSETHTQTEDMMLTRFMRSAALSSLVVALSSGASLRASAPVLEEVVPASVSSVEQAGFSQPVPQDKGLKALAKKLKAAVKAGKMTKEKAAKIWKAAVKKAKASKKKVSSKKNLAAIAKKLKAAVKAGKLTPAQAKAKWAALKGGKNKK